VTAAVGAADATRSAANAAHLSADTGALRDGTRQPIWCVTGVSTSIGTAPGIVSTVISSRPASLYADSNARVSGAVNGLIISNGEDDDSQSNCSKKNQLHFDLGMRGEG